jgi:hypothetical protein
MASILPAAQYVAVAPYWDYCQDLGGSIASDEANMWNDPQGDTDESIMLSAASNVQNYGQELVFYGMGPNTLSGSDTTGGRQAIVAGAGSGGAEAQTILRALTAGIRVMSSSRFTQANLSGVNDTDELCADPPSGTYVPIRGNLTFIDPTVFRPRGLALRMLNNHAIGGDFYPVDGAPAGVTICAFLQSDGWHVALTNSNAAAQSVTVTFPNHSAALPAHIDQISYSAATSNNETIGSPGVSVASGKKITRDSPIEITIPVPAYGTVVAYP